MIRMIAAVATNNQIGLDGQMPWHLPEDLEYFRNVTKGHPIIMGRKTFEAIGHPLPNRQNIILTRDRHFSVSGVSIIHSFEEALALCKLYPDAFIIGGGEIYKLFMPYADQLYLTLIDQSIDGDTSFPHYKEAFHCIYRSPSYFSQDNSFSYCFTIWEKIMQK